MADAETLFTVAEISRVLGVSRQAVAKRLGGHSRRAATGIVHGQPAQSYRFADLPAPLKEQVENTARLHGFDSARRFLEYAPARWEPDIAVGQMPPGAIDTAKRRMVALGPLLRGPGHRSQEELSEDGAQTYRDLTGENAATRTVRFWIGRALASDGGAEEWTRWELFSTTVSGR